jgi:hypothetical protein
VILVLFFTLPAVAAGGQTVSGTIRDASGSAVSGAEVSLRSMARSDTRSARSGNDGEYSITDVLPGKYQVTVAAPEFQPFQLAITVQPGTDANIDLVVAAATGEGKAVATPARQPPESMGRREVGNLPLNGRSASDVAALEPGVMRARTQTSGNGTQGYGTQMAIFGGRPRQNNSVLDGISVNDHANGPLGNAIGLSLGVDALEQLAVLTRNDQPQYGRSTGGVISSATRSGTNAFHGSLFYYVRNSVFDAKDYFNNQKSPFRRNQFGAAAGGPVWKNKVYIFGNYEGVRQSQGVASVKTVPSAAARDGILSSGKVTVDPAVRRFLDTFYPLPNRGLVGNGDAGLFALNGQRVAPGDHFTTRVDNKFSEKSSLYGAYMFDRGIIWQPDNFDSKIYASDSRQHFFTLGQTYNFSPTVVSAFRFGVNRTEVNTGDTLPVNPFIGDLSFGALPSKAAPNVQIAGMADFQGGLGAPPQGTFRWTSVQAYEGISIAHGNHTFKFGANVERMRDNMTSISDPDGRFIFNTLTSFLINKPDGFRGPLNQNVPMRGFRQPIAGAYFSDEWRVRPNFTATLGMRYEMATLLHEVHGYLTVLRSLTDPRPDTGKPLIQNPTLRNFEPRVGFAWDPFGTGKTVISSGFGVFDALPLPYEFQTGQLFSDPYFPTANLTSLAGNLPAGSFPNAIWNTAIAVGSTASREVHYEQNPGRNYAMQWNFSIQRQLPGEAQIKTGYVGSRGVHNLFLVQDADIVMPQLTPRGYLWPTAGAGTRLNPAVGRIDSVFWTGSSSYHALVLQLRKRVFHSAQVTATYTWGKSIDDGSSSITPTEYTNALSSPLWFAPGLNRGLSDFNVARNLRVLYNWELPRFNRPHSLLGWALSGWQLGGILEANSGVPFTAGIAGDPLGAKSTDTSIAVPDVLSGPGCHSLTNPGNPNHYIKTECFAAPNPLTLRGNLGRNTLIGPGMITLNSSVFKNNFIRSISRTFNLQFRAEVFNLLNRSNFRAPLTNRNVFDASGAPITSAGVIDSTDSPARQVQFALRMIW